MDQRRATLGGLGPKRGKLVTNFDGKLYLFSFLDQALGLSRIVRYLIKGWLRTIEKTVTKRDTIQNRMEKKEKTNLRKETGTLLAKT